MCLALTGGTGSMEDGLELGDVGWVECGVLWVVGCVAVIGVGVSSWVGARGSWSVGGISAKGNWSSWSIVSAHDSVWVESSTCDDSVESSSGGEGEGGTGEVTRLGGGGLSQGQDSWLSGGGSEEAAPDCGWVVVGGLMDRQFNSSRNCCTCWSVYCWKAVLDSVRAVATRLYWMSSCSSCVRVFARERL